MLSECSKYILTQFRVLEKEGIHCNMTLLFSLAQVAIFCTGNCISLKASVTC